MTEYDDLKDRLEEIEDTVTETPGVGLGPLVVYRNGDDYMTPDGDPVPTDDDGDPDLGDGLTIVLDEEYVEHDGVGSDA